MQRYLRYQSAKVMMVDSSSTSYRSLRGSLGSVEQVSMTSNNRHEIKPNLTVYDETATKAITILGTQVAMVPERPCLLSGRKFIGERGVGGDRALVDEAETVVIR